MSHAPQHIIANEEYCANKLAYPSSAVIQLRLSKLDPALFRVSGYELEPRKKLSDCKSNCICASLNSLERAIEKDIDLTLYFAPSLPLARSTGSTVQDVRSERGPDRRAPSAQSTEPLQIRRT